MKYINIEQWRLNMRSDAYPPIRVMSSTTDTDPVYANEVEIIGPAFMRHDPTMEKIILHSWLVLECADAIVIR